MPHLTPHASGWEIDVQRDTIAWSARAARLIGFEAAAPGMVHVDESLSHVRGDPPRSCQSGLDADTGRLARDAVSRSGVQRTAPYPRHAESKDQWHASYGDMILIRTDVTDVYSFASARAGNV